MPPEDADGDGRESLGLRELMLSLQRHWRVVAAVGAACAALALVRAVVSRPSYSSTAQILIEREDPFILSFRRVTETVERGSTDEFLRTQVRLIRSLGVAREVVRDLDLLKDPDFGGLTTDEAVKRALAEPPGQARLLDTAAGRVLGRLTVEPVRTTRLVSITARASRPQLAVSLANAVAERYIQQGVQQRFQMADEAANWLASQIEQQRSKVVAGEMALRAQPSGIEAPTMEERRILLEQRMRDLNNALTTARTRRLQAESAYAQMKAAPAPEDLPEVLRSPVVQALRADLAALERQLAHLQEKYLDQHPEITRVKAQVEVARTAIAGEAKRVVQAAENQYQSANAEEQGLSTALDQAKQELGELSRRAVPFENARRELDAAKAVLTSLMTRYQETDIARQLRASNIRVVERASMARPDNWTGRTLRVLLWGLMGASAAAAALFLRDRLDRSLRSPDDVRRCLSVPLLTMVPEMSRNGSAAPGPGGSSLQVESFRLLRAALAPGQARTVAVTSTLPGEGKTSVCVQLARSLSATGRRVLLVDSDFRSAGAHTLLGAAEGPGLAEVLAGTADALVAVQPLDDGRLSFLSAGTARAMGPDLLDAERLAPILERLRAAYDFVVVDTAPVAPVADALIVAPLAAATIVVVHAGSTPYAAVLETQARLGDAGARVVGVVLNRAHFERHPFGDSPHYGQADSCYARRE